MAASHVFVLIFTIVTQLYRLASELWYRDSITVKWWANRWTFNAWNGVTFVYFLEHGGVQCHSRQTSGGPEVSERGGAEGMYQPHSHLSQVHKMNHTHLIREKATYWTVQCRLKFVQNELPLPGKTLQTFGRKLKIYVLLLLHGTIVMTWFRAWKVGCDNMTLLVNWHLLQFR